MDMELIYRLGEAVVIAFLVGAVMGAVVAVHLGARSARKAEERRRAPVGGEARPARVKVPRDR